VAATVSRAKAAGSVYVDGPNSSFDGKNVYAFVADPSGVLVEFLKFSDRRPSLALSLHSAVSLMRTNDSPRLSGVLEPVCSEKAAPRKSVSADQEISKGYGIFFVNFLTIKLSAMLTYGFDVPIVSGFLPHDVQHLCARIEGEGTFHSVDAEIIYLVG